MADLQHTIEKAWQERAEINPETSGEYKNAILNVLDGIDSGRYRAAQQEKDGNWKVNQWVKKAVLLSFRIRDNKVVEDGAMNCYDKVPTKTDDWHEDRFKSAGFRMVAGTVVRKGSYVASDVVLMPSFVNIGAYIDSGTMIDTWSTVGSCAQIGKNCHISGGVGIGGVLEPLQANPVIIEDDCFIGARSEVAEGVIIGKGSVISMGVYLGQSTKIVDRDSGEIFYGKVPPYSVVVAGSFPAKKEGDPSLYCAVIVKKVDEKTRSKTSINELLRSA